MSSVDTAWLRMDSARNRMVIVGLFLFRTPVGFETLARLIEDRLLRHDRFRQKVEADATGYSWVDDEQFRLARHVKRVRLSGERTAALKRFVATLAGRRLETDHPLWQIHLVEGESGVEAMIVRVHHCIADGMALVRVVLSLADEAPCPETARSARAGSHGDDRHACGGAEGTLESNPWQTYLRPITHAGVSAIGATGAVWSHALELAADPEQLLDHARSGSRVVTDALAILLMDDDSPTRLKGKPGGRKAFAWNEPLPLDEVKPVCRALGASINDVLLACVAGALRRYLLARGDRVAFDCELRAMVPVNLRGPDEANSLGNRFGVVPLCLPVGIASPVERVREIHRRMDALKGGYQPILAYALLAVVGGLPVTVQDSVLGYLANKGTAVMTNVPGPREPLRMAGGELSRVMVWVPQSGDIGLGVAILSYRGGVQFGVVSDTRLCADPQAIVDGFALEFERLVLTLALLPNGVLVDREFAPGELEHALLGEPA